MVVNRRSSETMRQLPGYLSVCQAAKIMGVSERSIYGYLKSGRLVSYRLGGLLAIPEEALRAYRRPVVGRPRTRTPIWRVPVVMNLQYLLHITVRIRPGMEEALERKLLQIRAERRHLLSGTVACYIARNKDGSDEVQMVLIWRQKIMPPELERQVALEALRADLADILDWEVASTLEGEVLLNT